MKTKNNIKENTLFIKQNLYLSNQMINYRKLKKKSGEKNDR